MYKNKEFFQNMVDENKTIKELAELCNVTPKTITYWEKKHGLKLKRIPENIKSRKYFFNENYFEQIDTEEKAYFLGFIMADGYIDKKEKVLSIAVKNEDSYILEKLLRSINSNSILRNKKNNTQKIIHICSKKLIRDLKKYSITSNKTFSIKFPKLDENLMNHFIRGYFDGDGWIGESQCALIISSEEFLNDFINYLENKFKTRIYYGEIRKSYRVCFNRRDYKIINYIYSNSNIYLNRKKDRYEKFWKYYNESIRCEG